MTSIVDAFLSSSEHLIDALLKPATLVYDPSKRVFWGYLLASLLLAGLAMVVSRRKNWLSHLYKQLLSHHIWLHPSSRLDMKLMIVKSIVRTLLFVPWLMSSYGLAIAVVRFANTCFGEASPSSMHHSVIALLYTIVLFVASDFSRYLLHRMCHEIPIFWQFHQVHHSAEVMTPLTLYRSHPIENLAFVLRGIIVTGLVTGIFFYLYGTQAVQYQILGVNLFGALFNMLGANLRHSHVWISYGSFIERVLLSPAQHQIHHSNHPKHFGANYGSCLAIWDWIGGTLSVAKGQKGVRFGLTPNESNHNPHKVGSALFGPCQACWRLILSSIHQTTRAKRTNAYEESHKSHQNS